MSLRIEFEENKTIKGMYKAVATTAYGTLESPWMYDKDGAKRFIEKEQELRHKNELKKMSIER